MKQKINEYINKIEMVSGRTKLFSLPRWVQVEPTNLCNQSCEMCPRNTQLDSPLGKMSLENFKKVYEEIPTIKDLQLNGLGEPLINDDIFEMVKFAKSKGSNVTLTSNCELATKDKAEKLVQSGLDVLKISMDSADPAVYSSIRHGHLDRALEGVKNIVSSRKNNRSRLPRIWFNSILMESNYEAMLEIIKLGSELEIDYVRFKPINVFDVYQDKDLKVPVEKLFSKIEEVITQSKNFPVEHNLELLLHNKDIHYKPKETICPCFSPWLEVYIQWYGGVRLCCEFYSSKYDLGNLFEKPFREIWNGQSMRLIRELFKKCQMNFPVCTNCNRFQRNIALNNKINNFKKRIFLK